MSTSPEDETRLGPSASAAHPTSGASTGNSSGWLASSGAIDHGRFPPGTILVLAEEGGSGRLWLTLLFAAALVIPLLYAFIRYGLLTLATAMAVNQALQIAPLTLDLTKPHALASSMAIVVVGGLAAYAFHISRVGGGLLRRFTPIA